MVVIGVRDDKLRTFYSRRLLKFGAGHAAGDMPDLSHRQFRSGDTLSAMRRTLRVVTINTARVVLTHLAGHDEQGLHLEALVVGTEAVDVVLLFYINNFFRRNNGVDGQVVVTAIPEDD